MNIIEVETFDEVVQELHITKAELAAANSNVEKDDSEDVVDAESVVGWVEAKFCVPIGIAVEAVLANRDSEYRVLTDKAKSGCMIVIEVR